MISERSRNTIVGLTIIVAIAVCLFGIILLGKFPGFGGITRYRMTILAPSANGVNTSSRVEVNGVYAGQVAAVSLIHDESGAFLARIDLLINPTMKIPRSATASLDRPMGGVGNPSVQIRATEAASTPEDELPRDGSAVLKASVSDGSLIPREVIDDIHVARDVIRDKFGPAAENIGLAAAELSRVSRDLHVLLAYTTPEDVQNADPNDPDRPRENASTVIVRLNRTIESLQKLLDDPAIQGQIRQTVQNIADASAQLKAALEKIDTVVAHADTAIGSFGEAGRSINAAATQANSAIASAQQDIHRVSQQLVGTLGEMEKTIRLISEGKGTAGMLVNDPRLYNGLLDLSRSLKATVDDLNLLISKWKDEGVDLRLK